jgi:hypothetical protein
VAEHHRRTHDELADGAVRVVMHVAATDADRAQVDAHVVRAQRLTELDVAQAQHIFFFED